MNRLQFGLAAIYLVASLIAAAYLAGCLYFLFCKTMPANIEFDTWLRYWDAYADDAVQRKRLLAAAATAIIAVIAAPVAALAVLRKTGRSLHGDARWATSAEIRKAGLL
jgi:type IV secretion system protein VirD4